MSGIIRSIDRLGRIVIPIEFRKLLGISSDSELEISAEAHGVFLTPVQKRCCICHAQGGELMQIEETYLCINCAKHIMNQFKKENYHDC